MTLNNRPLLILEFLFLAFGIGSDPRFSFKDGDEHAGNVIVFHHLMNDGLWEGLHLIRDEADQAKAAHCRLEINVADLLIHFLLLRLFHDILCFQCLVIRHHGLTILKMLNLGDHYGELAVAVID